MTERLFDLDSKLCEFDAEVISCEIAGEKYEILLDKTAFFPNEGGQTSDIGILGSAQIENVIERDGKIFHISSSPLTVGETVHGKIDFSHRYYNMQNHTGEHIISGIVHAKYGYDNVGFHLSREGMTVDFSGELTRSQLDEIEELANRVIYECHPIKCYYPAKEGLSGISYRAKLENIENTRLVEIEGVDICACCAPHVHNTGEVGIIKILDFIRYKGGVRLNVVCGMAALYDYREKYNQCKLIGGALSVKQNEVFDATQRLLDTIDGYREKLYLAKRSLREYKIASIDATDGNVCIFEDDGDMNDMRELLNSIMPKCSGICACFVGNDRDGYKFIAASERVNMREIATKMKNELNARGGGSEKMIQGSIASSREKIQDFFK